MFHNLECWSRRGAWPVILLCFLQGLLFYLPLVVRDEGESVPPSPYHHKADEKQGYVFSAKVLGASLPVSLTIGSALLCCPGKMQCLLSWVLQPVWADQFSCFLDPRRQLSHLHEVARRRRGISLSRTTILQVSSGASSAMITLSGGSPAPALTVSTLRCCTGKLQILLS